MRMKGLLFGKRNRVIKLLLLLILVIYAVHVINQVLSFHLVVNSVIYFSNEASAAGAGHKHEAQAGLESTSAAPDVHQGKNAALSSPAAALVLKSSPITAAAAEKSGSSAAAESSVRSSSSSTCPKKEHIMFMKTHKCGSSSLQNMFLRFGDTNNLFFALPKIDNYFGHPIRFNRRFLLDPALLRKRYNLTYSILAHHLRFNYKELASVLPEDTIFLTILRQPISLFQSLFVYYDYAVNSLGSNLTLEQFALLFDHDPRFSAPSVLDRQAVEGDEGEGQQDGGAVIHKADNEDGHAMLKPHVSAPTAVVEAGSHHSNSGSLDEGGRPVTGQSIASSTDDAAVSPSRTQSSRNDDRGGNEERGASRSNGWTWSSFFHGLLMGRPMNGKSVAASVDGQHGETGSPDPNVSADGEATDVKLTEDGNGGEEDHNDGHYAGVTDHGADQRKRSNILPALLSAAGKRGSFSQQARSPPDPNFRVGGRFGRNQMSFDLGFNQKFFDSPNIVNNFIDAIDSMFHIVLMQERMEESLILLKHLLCWSTLDVVTFRHNVRSDVFNPRDDLSLSPRARLILQNLNHADHMMYEHFYAKFDSIVKAFGEDRMQHEVRELRQLTQQLYSQCVQSTQIMSRIEGSSHSNSKQSNASTKPKAKMWVNEKALGMVVRGNASHLCQQLTHSELAYTEILRKKQQVFLRTNKKLLNSFNSMHHILMNPPESHVYKHDRNYHP